MPHLFSFWFHLALLDDGIAMQPLWEDIFMKTI